MISINYFSKHRRKHGDEFEAHDSSSLNASAIQRKMAPFCRKKKRRHRSQLEKQTMPFCPGADVGEYFSVDYFASKTGDQHEFVESPTNQ